VVDLAGVLHQLPDVVIVAGRDMNITYVSAASEALLGWPPGELVGQPLTVLIPERLQSPHLAAFHRFVGTGERRLVGGHPVRLPALHRTGAEVTVDLLLRETEDGSIVGTLRDPSNLIELERRVGLGRYLAATVDVAARLQKAVDVEDALAGILPTLCAHLDWDVAALWVPDGNSLRCVDVWTDDAERVADFLVETQRSRFARGEGLPGRCWEAAEPVLQPSLDDRSFPRRAAAQASGLEFGLALPLLGVSGVRGVIDLFSRVARAADPELLEVVAGVGRQVGQFLDRADAEADLRRQEERYRSLVQATAFDVWTADAAGELSADMPRWRAFTGQTRSELGNAGWLSVVHPDDRDAVSEAWSAAVAACAAYDVEYRICNPEGDCRVVHARAVPIVENGQIREWIGITDDVTEERTSQQAVSELAATLQSSLLPPHLPSIPGVDLAARFRAGGAGLSVGGDFYDVFSSQSGVWWLVVGDVCGKGARPATVTARARYTLRAAALHARTAAEPLAVLNEALFVDGEPDVPFVTACVVRLELGDKVVAEIATAGHPPPLYLDGTEHVPAHHGAALGLFPVLDIAADRVELEPGNGLLVYTDGVPEARSEDGRELGIEPVVRLLSASAERVPDRVADDVMSLVEDHATGATRDDVALVVLRVAR
jgi:PAS domain S-box-containing protein